MRACNEWEATGTEAPSPIRHAAIINYRFKLVFKWKLKIMTKYGKKSYICFARLSLFAKRRLLN